MKRLLLTTILLSSMILSYSQFAMEDGYIELRKYVVAIGTVQSEQIKTNNGLSNRKRFFPIGTGLMTYIKNDTSLIYAVITARHVTQALLDAKLSNVYVRPSWADTISTTEYFGEEVPFVDKGLSNYFMFPDKKVDLSCILFNPPSPSVTIYKINPFKVFPYNSISTPHLGDQVWIGGYPQHIENIFGNQFLYSIATFKQGTVAWKPSENLANTELSHITLVESNATHGNSGGPVFDLNGQLIGILVSGNNDIDSVTVNGQVIHDSSTNAPYITQSRAGVSIIERAEYVKKMIEYVQTYIKKVIDDVGKKSIINTIP